MKQINVYFDDKDYNALIKMKKDLSWNKFIIWMLKQSKENGNE